MVTRALAIVATALGLLAACGQPRTYNCTTDQECVLGAVPGRCEVDGFCSFPDITCASGSRYGVHAPLDVRDSCVAQPSNDTCEATGVLTLTEPGDGSLRGAASTGLLACSPQATGDVFYELALDECSDVTLRAEAPSGNLGVALLNGCTDMLGCADQFQTSTPETLEVVGVPAGIYQVGVAGVLYDDDFTVTASIAPPPANDLVAGATLSSPFARTQSLARAADDLACDGRTGARDLYYALELPGNPDARTSVVDVQVDGHGSSDFAVALLDRNANPASVVCVPTVDGAVRFDAVPPGSYVVAVDGPRDGACGRFDVAVASRRIDPHDQCANPSYLGLLRDVSLFDSGDLTAATDHGSGSCGGSGNDLVYRFIVNTPMLANIRVTRESGVFSPVVYLRRASSGDCNAFAEVMDGSIGSCDPLDPNADVPKGQSKPTCATGATIARLDGVTLVPGAYHVVVDGEGGAGAFLVEVQPVKTPGDLPPGGELDGICFGDDATPPGEVGCCDAGTTVGAESSGVNGCITVDPDVFRSIPVPNGCIVDGAIDVISPSPHWLDITHTGNCTSNAVCASSPAFDGALYRTTALVQVRALGPSCSIRVRVIAKPAGNHFVVRYTNTDAPACL